VFQHDASLFRRRDVEGLPQQARICPSHGRRPDGETPG
jgi:hypothetical protein